MCPHQFSVIFCKPLSLPPLSGPWTPGYHKLIITNQCSGSGFGFSQFRIGRKCPSGTRLHPGPAHNNFKPQTIGQEFVQSVIFVKSVQFVSLCHLLPGPTLKIGLLSPQTKPQPTNTLRLVCAVEGGARG